MNLKELIVGERLNLIVGAHLNYIVLLRNLEEVELSQEVIREGDIVVRANNPYKGCILGEFNQDRFYERIIPIFDLALQEASVRIAPQEFQRGIKSLLYANTSASQTQLGEQNIDLGVFRRYLISVSQVYAEKANTLKKVCLSMQGISNWIKTASIVLSNDRALGIITLAKKRGYL